MGGSADPVFAAGPVVVVYPDGGKIASRTLARRLAAASSARSSDPPAQVRLVADSALAEVDPDRLRTVTALVVDPAGCALSALPGLAALQGARRRIAVAAGEDESDWPAVLSEGGIEIDAIIEVGFAPREHERPGRPRTFLYNAPSVAEADLIRSRAVGCRPLPWALVGHATPARAALADALVRQFSGNGIVFLPPDRQVGRGGGMLGEAVLARLLSVASYYVWCSRGATTHYESHRFLEAVLAGAVPCKIDPARSGAPGGLPTVYRSVSELVETAGERGADSLFEDARDYYLAHGTLEDLLPEALGRACGAAGHATGTPVRASGAAGRASAAAGHAPGTLGRA